ncbi:MAG: hypothetical protein DMG85_20550 [Acidobacteria bacterium]|nr:MAG: hypothetical protein DMG85_20550 [Acidobacteriota bacterium]
MPLVKCIALSVTSMDLFWPLWRYILEFGAVLAVAGILRMVGTWISRRAQNRARNWPYVYGTVEHAEPNTRVFVICQPRGRIRRGIRSEVGKIAR